MWRLEGAGPPAVPSEQSPPGPPLRAQSAQHALRAEAPDEHTRGKPGAPRGLRAAGRDAGAWGVASGEGARWGRSPCVGSAMPLIVKTRTERRFSFLPFEMKPKILFRLFFSFFK